MKVSSNRIFFSFFLSIFSITLRHDTNPVNLDSQSVFPLTFLTQIIIFVNQQDDYDDGRGVGGQTPVMPKITVFAAQSYKRGAKNPVLLDLDDLQKQPRE